MVKNIGCADKVVRWVIGVAIIFAGLFYDSWWGALGLIPIITALISWCPLYVPIKISTIKKQEPK
ncbi:MAG: DUF2892 domain-containing protein [bacterium]|nr:DUF2892 domain-containing protein [bacterium]MDD5354815.1 DUF2892 domain-containing protein [bacterium]MDD5756094.1 DUF2892 domain-containing protein [bacterium]